MYASFRPVTRLSSQAIDFLYKRRLFIAERYKKVKSKKCVWPIGELFIPTELMQNNFTCQRIKYESCSIQEIDLNETRLFENPDNYLYHSVKGDLLNRLQKAQTRRTLFVKIRDKLMGYLAKYKKFK